jgi:serine/threonine-protein kinase
MIICLGLFAAVSACQGPPPTQIVLVVTATPSETTNVTNQAVNVSITPQKLPDVTPTSTLLPPTATTIPATPTFDPFPTATLNQIQVAEQVFEHGRMFWIQPRKQIWVMTETSKTQGKWAVYDDTFEDGEQDKDPTIIAPAGKYQPERGFGKLWRLTPNLRDTLGWGLTPEFGYVSNYEYHPGGTVDTKNQYTTGPGFHILFSLYQEKFQFNEADGSWKKL